MSSISTTARTEIRDPGANRNILLTGGTGFLGSLIARAVSSTEYRLFVLKRKDSDIRRIHDLVECGRISLIDIDDNLPTIFKAQKFDIVIHAATSYGRDGETYDQVVKTNIALPMTLLELAVTNASELFINADTFFELSGDTNQKDVAYIRTKKEFVRLAAPLAKNIKFANFRLEHLYGPDDNPTKLVPFLIRVLRKGGHIDFNRGEQERDFIYGPDAAQAFLQAIGNSRNLGPWEEFGIGTGETHTIRELAQEIQKNINALGSIRWGANPYAPGENMYSKADLSNNSKIGWKHTHSFDSGVKKTVESYLSL